MENRHVLYILAVLAFFAIYSRIDFNGIFVDESYYINIGKSILAGRLHEVFGNPLEVMFGFYLAPVFFAVADTLGGLIFARMISTFFIIGTIVSVYLITQKLFNNQKISVVSFVFSLFFAPIFFLGKFAVLDAPSLFFAAASLLFAVTGVEKKTPRFLVISSILLFLSFLSKYVSVILFIPLAVFVFYKKRKLCAHFVVPYVVLVAAFMLYFLDDMKMLLFSRLQGQAGIFAPGIPVILLLPYLLLCIYSRKNRILQIFLIPSLLVIVMQSFLTDPFNGFKHPSLAFIFIAPFASYGFYTLSNSVASGIKNRKNGTKKLLLIAKAFFVALVSICIIASFYYGNQIFENYYPDERNVSQVLDSVVSNDSNVLVEGFAYVYYTKKLDITRTVQNFWFDYNKDGISEQKDFESAIENGEFDAILVSGYYRPAIEIDGYINRTPYFLYYEEDQAGKFNNLVFRIYLKKQNESG
jgi:4-amino-4-deoxy-L-arabinose transferase-like glycosyltransferase